MVMFVFPLGCMLMNCLLTMTYANSSGLVAHTSPEPMCLHQRIDPLTSSLADNPLSLILVALVFQPLGKTKFPLHAPKRSDRKSTRLNSSHLVISYAVF